MDIKQNNAKGVSSWLSECVRAYREIKKIAIRGTSFMEKGIKTM